MSKSSISTFELFQMFPDAESASAYFETRRWPDGATCPACGEAERIGARKGGLYRCNACLLDFTIRTGTIFERSKVPLHKWIYAMYLLVMARKGISSVQLHEQIGVTQKTAWFMLQRLREACGNEPTELAGIMSDAIKAILDAVTDRVLAYHPADKGLQAKKVALRDELHAADASKIDPGEGMRRYVSTKAVNAKPMTRGDYNELRGWELLANECGDDAGYLVEYADVWRPNLDGFAGYVSWSPADVFEAAYR